MATPGARSSRNEDDMAQDTSSMENERSTLENDIKQLREDVSLLSEHIREIGSRSMSRAQRAARDGADQLRGTAEDVQEEVAEMVREKPFTALALAAGIGYLFALISHR